MPAPAKNPEDMRRVLDKRKTPLDASWVLLSAGAHQRAEVFPKDPLARIAPVEGDPPPREVECGTLEGQRPPTKTAHGDIIPTFPSY